MASPQLENGYSRISNEVLEAICRARLSGNEVSVLLYTLRQTYGWSGRKKTEPLKIRWLSGILNMSKSGVSLAIQVLIERGIISRDLSGRLSFLKDHEKWGHVVQPAGQKPGKVSSGLDKVSSGLDKVSSGLDTYKDKEKKEIKKDVLRSQKLTSQQRLIRYFKESKGVNADDKDWDRRHFCGRLVKEATEYLKAFDGDVTRAGEYLLIIGEEWKDLPDWSLPGARSKAGRDPRLIGGEDGLENGKMDADRLAGPGRPYRSASTRAIARDTLRAIETAVVRGEKPSDVASDGVDRDENPA